MYYIYDVRKPNEPFMFHDQDAGTQNPAIFDTEEKAMKMCEIMNFCIQSTTYKVGKTYNHRA